MWNHYILISCLQNSEMHTQSNHRKQFPSSIQLIQTKPSIFLNYKCIWKIVFLLFFKRHILQSINIPIYLIEDRRKGHILKTENKQCSNRWVRETRQDSPIPMSISRWFVDNYSLKFFWTKIVFYGRLDRNIKLFQIRKGINSLFNFLVFNKYQWIGVNQIFQLRIVLKKSHKMVFVHFELRESSTGNEEIPV